MTAYTLITGATGGIGLAFAELFAKKGYSLILVARNEERLKKIQKWLISKYCTSVEVIACDLAESHGPDDVFQLTTKRGWQVDILINNVGFGDFNCFLDTARERQRNMVDINILALMHLTHLYGKNMRQRKRGKILNVASLASFCAGPYMSVYYASKSFVHSFSEALSEELAPYGITVTALCPGPVDTGFMKNAGLEKSRMFHMLQVSDAAAVARAGYQGMSKGKTLVYYGWMTKAASFFSRICPRKLTRKVAMYVNSVKDSNK